MKQEDFTRRYSYDPVADLLGSGGFGKVFKAWDNDAECYVAIKMQSVDPRYPGLRLSEEVEKAARLRHPNVARYKECYTFSTMDGTKDIAVMSYYEDGSLDKLLASGKLGREDIFSLLTEILEGVAYLHSEGIIHRDLKPQNVLILHHRGRYMPKITDFGISKQLDDGQSSAVSNSVLGGTRSYASPEQLKDSTIRKNTDLWSFGVIAFQMLVGKLPFDCGKYSVTSEEGRLELFRQMMSGVLPEAIDGVPEPWQRLIRECLTVDNEKRIAHAEDCLAIIRRGDATAVEGNSTEVDPEPIALPVEAVEVIPTPKPAPQATPQPTPAPKVEPKSTPKPIPQKPTAPKKRSKWWLWLLLLAIVGGGVIAYLSSQPKDSPEPTDKHTTIVPDTIEEVDSVEVVAPIVEPEQPVVEPEPTPAPIPEPTPAPDPVLRLTSNNSVTLSHSGGNGTIRYTLENPVSGVNLSVSDDASWLTTSRSGNTISYSVSANESQSSRTATITVSYGGQSFEVAITQSGKPAPAPTPAPSQPTAPAPSPTQSRSNYTESGGGYGISMKMVWVEGGTFQMGSTNGDSDEQPVHPVTLSGYWIAETEVTQAQWEAVMGTQPSHDYGVGPNYPVYYVSYTEALEFCRRLSSATGKRYTLPTEAQWEYAARGGQRANGIIFTYSGSNTIGNVAWYTSNSSSQTHPVKSKQNGANQLGLYDMSGNVWEWCLDWYSSSYYSSSPQNNPQGPSSGQYRVLRGGSWNSNASGCRVANRGYNTPSYRGGYNGFRVVCLP